MGCWGEQGLHAVVMAMNMNTPSKKSDSAGKKSHRKFLSLFSKKTFFNTKPWIVSLTVHVAVIVLLALWSLPVLSRHIETLLDMSPESSEVIELDEVHLEQLDLKMKNEFQEELLTDVPMDTSMMDELTGLPPEEDLELASGAMERIDFGEESSLLVDFTDVSGLSGQGLAGRGQLAKARMLYRYGGSMASEKAVKESLDWLARHQNPDGTWSFDHRFGLCQGRCGEPGKMREAARAATGLALLPFLGAGQTHKTSGPYRKVVKRGVAALLNLMEVTEHGGSFHESGGRMYSHGIASMAISEAYAMTKDRDLRQPAQLAINYICYAQDPVGGGWRYEPQQPGDTSVVGWQIMALKSGYSASLSVPSSVPQKASLFLDSMQVDRGEGYCYGGKKACTYKPTTSAIGLLSRMYLGWKQDNKILQKGIQRLANEGPSETNAYYNYYATQALFQFTGAQGKLWTEWNEKMLGMLVQSQSRDGHEKGSWAFDLKDKESHNSPGGRLYCTTMASMTLEVYYRYLPIYQSESVQSDFE